MNHHQMIGSVGEFFAEYDDWDVYHERLEQFFEVNDVPEAKRSAFLISVIGADAYKSLRDLCHPVVPKDKPFEELCELLRKQFSRQVAIYRERTKFYNARHEDHENATQWYGRLKRLSVDCKFGSNLEQVLLDKFVTGLRPGQVLDRLCEEPETLKLEQALDIAINKECAAKDSAYLPVKNKPVEHPMYRGGPAPLAICPQRRPAPFSIDPPHSEFAPQVAPYTVESAPLVAMKCAANPVARFAMMDALEPENEQAEGFGASAPALGAAPEDGPPEEAGGAPKVAAAPAVGKAKRVRTRRRGRGGRGADADNASDKHSVDGEGKE